MELKPGELGTTLFELAPFAVVVVDRCYNIIAANPAFRASYGDWEGSHCYEVFKRQHRPCSRCAALDTFRDGQVHVTEERGMNREGNYTFFEVKTAPLFDAEGHVERVLEMTIDISRLKDLETRYQLLFERVPCFITVIDREYRIVDANWRHRETFGEGELCHELYMHSAHPCEECPVRRTFEDGRIHVQQKQVLDTKGQTIHLMVQSAPLYDRSGKIETVIELATDVTPLVELQNRLLHIEPDAAMHRSVEMLRTTLEQLLSDLGEVSILRDLPEQADATARNRVLDGLDLRIDHIISLLAVMTHYDRRAELPACSTSMQALVDAVVRLLDERTASSRIQLRSEVDEGLPAVMGPAETLRDCLACLIYDFVAFCPPRGLEQEAVLLRASSSAGGEPLLEISRVGLGLVTGESPPADGAGQGMSMSLALARRVLNQCGGSVDFSSSQERGITFRVTLCRQ